MGQKTNPIAYRLSIKKNWTTLSDTPKNTLELKKILSSILKRFNLLHSNITINSFIDSKGAKTIISLYYFNPYRRNKNNSYIVRFHKNYIIFPLYKLQQLLSFLIMQPIYLNFIDISPYYKYPIFNARILGGYLVLLIKEKKRFNYYIKKIVNYAQTFAYIKGLRISLKGRIPSKRTSNRSQSLNFGFGPIPLSTLSSNIDYHYLTITTIYGITSIKIWIYYSD